MLMLPSPNYLTINKNAFLNLLHIALYYDAIKLMTILIQLVHLIMPSQGSTIAFYLCFALISLTANFFTLAFDIGTQFKK